MNYREVADLPNGRKFRQLKIMKNQATNLSVKATGLNLKAAKSVIFLLLNGLYLQSGFKSMQSKLWMAYCKTDVSLIPQAKFWQESSNYNRSLINCRFHSNNRSFATILP